MHSNAPVPDNAHPTHHPFIREDDGHPGQPCPVCGEDYSAFIHTGRCPEVRDGLPCQKRTILRLGIHSGGHWFQADAAYEAMTTGHYDARAVLAGELFTVHQPEDCPGPDECTTARFGDAL